MVRGRALIVLAMVAGVMVAPSVARAVDSPPAVYPPVGPGTHLIDEDRKLSGFNDPDWYKANIPFLDVPDTQIEDVYYYRWRTWKEHLRYTDPRNGWISTEFLDCCGYAAPYQAIDAAAGHQLSEGRWVRDQTYGNDYLRFWLTGPGAGAKPAVDGVNADTTDWAHEYGFWAASTAYDRAKVTGDASIVEALLPALEKQWHGWDKQFNPNLGLYWSVPVWDAMELSASSYQSSDPYHGGAGYRPTLNSYQYGDAVAISKIAALAGDGKRARDYAAKAAALKASMQKYLWDPQRRFYYHVARDQNPTEAKLDTREEIGFIPWQFDAAEPGDAAAWAQLTDPQGFASAYGPTTAERRSSWFMHEAANCCRWDGPSWPFSTSQTLAGMANLLDDYPAQSYVTAQDYYDQLRTYALTQYRNGTPYVAEAHDPDEARWIYDGNNHSEDYNHSTFTDLVINGLIGLRPQIGDTLTIKPLVPASWDHFALENVPYHGHNISVAYDRPGTYYGIGTGLRIFVDGTQVASRAVVAPLQVQVPSAQPAAASPRLVDDAANPLRTEYPKPITSYTWPFDNAWNPLDGKVWFNEVPENTRWTNYSSPNVSDWYGVDFGVPTPVSDVRWYGYDDGGGVRSAAAYDLQYWTGSEWADVPDQTRNPAEPEGNGLNRITFPELVTAKIRLTFTNPAGAFVGVTELQSWSASSQSADVTVGPQAATGNVLIDGATPVTVTVRNTSTSPLANLRVALAVPDGWSGTQTGQEATAVQPNKAAQWQYTLTPPAGEAGGTIADVVATATYTVEHHPESTHARQPVMVPFPSGQADPLATWTMDEGAGAVAHDTSGQGHDLSLTGSPAWTTGTSGTAVQFDGQSQYGTTDGPVLDTVGNFTVAAWVKLDSTATWATAVSQDGNPSSGFYLQYSAADTRLAFSTSEGRALSDDVPVTGRWYHLVGVHDANAGTYTLYVDGSAQKTVLQQAQGDPAAGSTAVGRAFSGGHNSDFWPGAIDQVHVWNRMLPSDEVNRLYLSGS